MEDIMAELITEKNNPNTVNIDQKSTLEMLEMINREDITVPQAVKQTIPDIAKAVDGIVYRMQQGGRLIYIGAGTSGRLGILDASECPPTYGTPPGLVVGVIAGGPSAILQSMEGIEDRVELGIIDITTLQVRPVDTVVGIAASGRTPYVLAALREAKKHGAFTVGICNSEQSELEVVCDVTIAVVVGPEVIMGSTRMKAGTAQKLVLNMISTSTMVKLGKVYKNFMVDLNAQNDKLYYRSVRMIQLLTGVEPQVAEEVLDKVDGKVKTAILMIKGGLDDEQAKQILQENGGVLRAAIETLEQRDRGAGTK